MITDPNGIEFPMFSFYEGNGEFFLNCGVHICGSKNDSYCAGQLRCDAEIEFGNLELLDSLISSTPERRKRTAEETDTLKDKFIQTVDSFHL
jgi:hypothetical protein